MDSSTYREKFMEFQSSASNFEIESKNIFHVSFGKNIETIKTRLTKLENCLPDIICRISIDIVHWRQLSEKLDSILLYIISKNDIMHLPKAVTSYEIAEQLLIIEVMFNLLEY